jgi:hypothetical protein
MRPQLPWPLRRQGRFWPMGYRRWACTLHDWVHGWIGGWCSDSGEGDRFRSDGGSPARLMVPPGYAPDSLPPNHASLK